MGGENKGSPKIFSRELEVSKGVQRA